jgi:hypothetical protein
MPATFTGPVPPEHPMFNGQVFFAFQNELPEDEVDEAEAEDEGVEFVSPHVPGRGTWRAKTGRRASEDES